MKMIFLKAHLTGKAYISFDTIVYIDGTYRSNTVVNTNDPRKYFLLIMGIFN